MVDTVYYIWKNQIHRGVIVEQLHIEGDNGLYFRVKTHYGLQVFACGEIRETVEQLAESIMHESYYEST